jgi:hypothetical protein
LEAAFGNLDNLCCIPETTVRYVLPRHKVADWGGLGMLSAIAAAQRASPVPTTPRRQAWGKLMARVGEEKLRADTRKTPLQRGRQAFRERLSVTRTREHATHEPLISRAMLEETQLTGLSTTVVSKAWPVHRAET